MNRSAYVYHRVDANLYTFVSEGVGSIEKVVEFTYVNKPGVMNLGFGDRVEGRMMDDEVISNNGDLTKVMATVIKIVEDYTGCYPDMKILFCGSTPERTKMYGRILRTYYTDFRLHYSITGLVQGSPREIAFDPANPYLYDAYLVKRKQNDKQNENHGKAANEC